MTTHARLLLALVAALAAAPARAQPPQLRVASGGAETALGGILVSGAAVFPIALLETVGAQVLPTPDGGRVVLYGDTIRLTAGSPFFRSTAGLHQLAYPVHRSSSALYVPEQFWTAWLPERFNGRVDFSGGVLRFESAIGSPLAEASGPRPAPQVPSTVADEPRPAQPMERVVILDPGHGGPDPGKVGPGGVQEKTIVLAIARRLASILDDRGYEVHLTRQRDTLIALGDRPHLANEWKGNRQRALFVSIHANAWNRGVRGFETYFLSDAKTEDARRVAEMENAAQAYEETTSQNSSEAELILNSLRNDFYVRASNDLAGVVQRRIDSFHPGPNRGVKQAAFRVLVGAFMPAVLIETAFISDPAEARLLASSDFQQKLAFGIADAIDEFFTGHEHLWSTEAR